MHNCLRLRTDSCIWLTASGVSSATGSAGLDSWRASGGWLSARTANPINAAAPSATSAIAKREELGCTERLASMSNLRGIEGTVSEIGEATPAVARCVREKPDQRAAANFGPARFGEALSGA